MCGRATQLTKGYKKGGNWQSQDSDQLYAPWKPIVLKEKEEVGRKP